MGYEFFKNWDTKTCLWAGMVFFAFVTLVLALFGCAKEYVMASFALTGQLAAGLMTYVNSNKSVAALLEQNRLDLIEKG